MIVTKSIGEYFFSQRDKSELTIKQSQNHKLLVYVIPKP